MIGRVYMWRGQTWAVLIRWKGKGPRNVLIERVVQSDNFRVAWVGTGEKVVRPFRGLRRIPGSADYDGATR